MTAAPKPKVSPAKAAANTAFAAAGRAAQARARAAYSATHHGLKKPRSLAQTQASLRWAAAGRAAQAARKAGKVYKKKAAAVAPAGATRLPGWWSLGCNDVAPDCAAVAVANHLLAATGLEMPDNEIALLHKLAGGDDREGGVRICDVLEVMRANPYSFVGGHRRIIAFTSTDEDIIVAGLVVALDIPHGFHAVLSHPQGMVSWGRVMPWQGIPREAWAIEWQ